MSIFRILSVLVLSAAPAFAAGAEPSGLFTPYFNMSLSEGVGLPSQGNFFSGGGIDTRLGLLTKFSGSSSLFALYNLRYAGPGFQPQDARQFQERSLDHNFNAEYRLKLDERLTLRPGGAYTMGYRRLGANETWDSGLYNVNTKGGQLAADYRIGWFEDAGLLTAQVLYRQLRFPNYTDLLREFEGSGASSELGAGLEDQNLTQFSARVEWRDYFGGISRSQMGYINQTVIGSDGQYSGAKQGDSSLTVDGGIRRKIGRLSLAPSLGLTFFRSDQAFLRYKFFGAAPTDISNPSADVTLIENAYSYNELALSIPIQISADPDAEWTVSGGLNLTARQYSDRPPRDAQNNFQSGRQRNLLTKLYAVFRRRLNEAATMDLTYAFIVAASNNHFETYLPYNYTAHSFGIAYNLAF
ncbi:MAG: hypothetical protein PHP45_10865 [Elusimicrobiales bacterium]|nr:hypothetical protein [Elusimicrobiales bacterium]